MTQSKVAPLGAPPAPAGTAGAAKSPNLGLFVPSAAAAEAYHGGVDIAWLDVQDVIGAASELTAPISWGTALLRRLA